MHKLLKRQIEKYLPKVAVDDEGFNIFLSAISESYDSFERDKVLSSHAFALSENDYNEINHKLVEEIDSRKISIAKLKETIMQIDSETDFEDTKDDIVSIAEYVRNTVEQQREFETQLLQYSKRMTSLISSLHSGILLENENREIVLTNEIFISMFGIPARPAELVGLDCTKMADQNKSMFKHGDRFVERVEQLINKKELVTGDIIELNDGRWFERDFIPIFVDSDFKGHLWIYTDITEKNRILNSIAESEAKSKLIMNSALDAIITIDEMGHILLWNPQAEKIFGWKEEDVVGKVLSETIIPERLRASHEQGMARFRRTSQGTVLQKIIELPAINKDGNEFPVELSIAPIYHDNKIFFCSFIRDISERKRSELALATSEQKYRSIIANMNLGLLEVDQEDRIQFCNQSFTDISGYTIENIRGKSASSLFTNDKGKQVITEKNDQRKKGNSDSFELEIINKIGDKRWWLISGAPNYNDSGEIIGSIGIHLDITKQKKLEQQLGAALIKAQIASEAKQNFIANMSHEIRTPLNAIIGMVRELGREKLNKTQHVYVENSEIAAKHLLSMVNNILDISKIEAGEIIFENSEFSLESLVEMVKNILEIQAQEKGLKCICQLSRHIKPVLIGDSSRIRQVLINLIGNAIKFTDRGSVKLEVNVISTSDKLQKLQFAIEDTGRGMSPEFLKTIFDKFSREQLLNSKKIEGTGLGMPITKELINLMGGTLNVKSTQGEGTTVEFEIELAVGDASNILSQTDTITQNNLSGLNCLLVEDNEMNRLIAGKSLKFFGCNVTEASNGVEAIELLKKNVYHFILMDIQMPVMDGLEATKYIRNQLKLKLPIIALTANAFKSDIDAYLAIGMNSYVNKPYEEQALYHVITEVLGPQVIEHLKIQGKETTLGYDLSKINEISRGDQAFVSKMISLFVTQLVAFLPELKQAQLNSEFMKIGKIAHQLKPGIETLQIKQLIPLVVLMEREGLAEQPNVKLLFQTMNEFEVISRKNIQSLNLEIE